MVSQVKLMVKVMWKAIFCFSYAVLDGEMQDAGIICESLKLVKDFYKILLAGS